MIQITTPGHPLKMSSTRLHHATVSFRDELYVFCGIQAFRSEDNYAQYTTSVRYSPATNSWSEIEPPINPRRIAPAALLLADGKTIALMAVPWKVKSSYPWIQSNYMIY